MQAIRRFIPYYIKRYIKIRLRYGRDLLNGDRRKMDLRRSTEIPVNLVKSITQPLKSAASALVIKQNLFIALNKLEGLQICPGQHLSVWHVVGDSAHKNGYHKIRTMIIAQIQIEVG